MQAIWLNNYPPEVPKTLDLDPTETLLDVFESSVAAWSDRPAFHNLGHSLTYAEIDQLSQQFAAYLQDDLGLNRGDRVAIMMPNFI